jgi:hypothetical protein
MSAWAENLMSITIPWPVACRHHGVRTTIHADILNKEEMSGFCPKLMQNALNLDNKHGSPPFLSYGVNHKVEMNILLHFRFHQNPSTFLEIVLKISPHHISSLITFERTGNATK